MGRHPSAIKRNRQNKKRRDRNRDLRSRMKTAVKNTLAVIQEGDREKALETFRSASSVIDRTRTKGALHKKSASRKVSRLARKIAALGA